MRGVEGKGPVCAGEARVGRVDGETSCRGSRFPAVAAAKQV